MHISCPVVSVTGVSFWLLNLSDLIDEWWRHETTFVFDFFDMTLIMAEAERLSMVCGQSSPVEQSIQTGTTVSLKEAHSPLLTDVNTGSSRRVACEEAHYYLFQRVHREEAVLEFRVLSASLQVEDSPTASCLNIVCSWSWCSCQVLWKAIK